MSANTIEHLVKMVNQIVAGVPGASTEEKVESTAAHINKFWAPLLKRQITEFVAGGGEGLTPAAKQAVVSLNRD